jgi:hypothetical protein
MNEPKKSVTIIIEGKFVLFISVNYYLGIF